MSSAQYQLQFARTRQSWVRRAILAHVISWSCYLLTIALVAAAGLLGWFLSLLLMAISATIGLIGWTIAGWSRSLQSPEGGIGILSSLFAWGGGILVELFLAWPNSGGTDGNTALWGLVPMMIGGVPAVVILWRAQLRTGRLTERAAEAVAAERSQAEAQERGETLREVIEVDSVIEVVEDQKS